MSGATGTQPSGSSWTQKALTVTITLGTGAFGNSGQNTVKLSGLRVVASILKGAAPSMDSATVRIYGTPPSILNQITTLGVPLTMARQNNTFLVEAGDNINGMSVVYSGQIYQAYASFDEAPDTSLVLVGWTGQYDAIAPVKPISYAGSTDVATIMASIANQAGWSFENSGVQVQISNPYFPGTALQQAHDVARAAGCQVYLDSGTSPPTLAIWKNYGTRGGMVPLINAASGLIGYPKFASNGLSFRCLFNRNIKIGGQIQMDSTAGGNPQPISPAQAAAAQLPPNATTTGGANGIWCVCAPLVYDLSAQVPDGPFFLDVNCVRTVILSP